MIPRAVIFLCSVVLVAKLDAAVTNEDIRVAILQIVNVVRATDDKLERHEYRERLLGEQLKKGLLNLDKRIKLLDPLRGTVSRIDERLATVETILMQKDKEEKERQMQQKKIYEAVLDLQKNLPLIIDQLNTDLSNKIISHEPPAAISEPMMSKKDFESMEKAVLTRIDKVSTTINSMETELSKMRSDNINSIQDLNNRSSESLDKVKRQLDSSEQLLERYENKLAEYNNKIPERLSLDFKEHDEWKDRFLKALETQKSQVKEVLNDVKTIQRHVEDIPTKTDVQAAYNTTLHKLEEIKENPPVVQQPAPTVSLEPLEKSLMEVKDGALKNKDALEKSFNQLSEITSHLAESFSTNYEKISSEIKNMAKLEQVVMQTADGVLDTKRRVEYGVHQILAEVTKQMKENSNAIGEGINERFDAFELSILDEETGALHNLTSKIGEEIDQVWRQIGIMHQQMSASTDTLNKLQNQTDTYVNGSLGVMDSMKGKVGQITTRMSEVDENLNYLLGRLSLVTQEFNQIKSGLGSALDQIRASFHAVQDKIKDNGPGPHKISSNEIVDAS